jgi:hypothetical protein
MGWEVEVEQGLGGECASDCESPTGSLRRPPRIKQHVVIFNCRIRLSAQSRQGVAGDEGGGSGDLRDGGPGGGAGVRPALSQAQQYRALLFPQVRYRQTTFCMSLSSSHD